MLIGSTAQTSIVTFSHFSDAALVRLERGGFEVPDAADLFARHDCGRDHRNLGELMGRATTFNEANVQLLLQIMGPSRIASLGETDDRLAAN